MSVENPENTPNISNDNEVKTQNGEQHDQQRFNGLSNGHIESSSSHHKHKSSKDKHRDRDREHKSSKSSSSTGREKDSDKHKSSSSNDKDRHKDRERSDKDKEKHRDRDRDKDKDKHHKDKDRDKDREKHKSSSSHHHSSHHKSSNRDKDKERDKERTKDKEHREHGKDKERDKDKERHKDKEKEKKDGDRERERKKEHKSSSSHNKDRDRDRERSDRDKDRHHKSSKDKHSSSSSKSKDKDKERHSTSSKDKERNRDKEKKERHEANDNKDHVDSKHNLKIGLEPPRNDYDQSCSGFPVKEENDKNNKLLNSTHNKTVFQQQQQYKEEMTMNYSQASSCDYSMSQFRDDESTFVVKEEMPDESQEIDGGQEENRIQIKDEPEEEEYDEGNDPDYDDDEEDIPLAKRKLPKVEAESEDDVPLVSRKKLKTEKKKEKEKEKEKKVKKKKREEFDDDDYADEKPKKKKIKKEIKTEPVQQISPIKGRKKKEEEPEDVWKWWEEEKRDDGVKWTFLEHRGPVFAPPYEPLPDNVKFYYDGKPIKLSNDAEEIASFYAKMLTHDYVTKKQFNDNFFKDWRKSMTSRERELIRDLSKCNFKEMNDFYTAQSEKRKQMSKEEKQAIKEENERLIKEYGFCIIDGHRQRIGNFKLEPPGLFRGRGEHPKMGLVKRRLMPEDILINCSKDSKIPEPPKGHKWKEIRHDNTVTWLASWTENIQGQVKYIMLNPSSKLKGEKDYQKYETARRLDRHIDKIRQTYREEWKSKEMKIRQRGVALYFIDKLALRAGNEKDEDQADTVGCCSLRVEHIKLHKELDGKENVVEFDFLGKDSIRYYNRVEVEKRVFKNLELFMENKKEGDDLFDRLNTMVLNEHLREIMEGLTAKVFRTYNASITLQQQLDLLTDPNSSVPEKLLSYNRANRAVAILCNHQRSIPKSHEKSMENLKEKIRQRREQLEEAEAELHDLQKLAKRGSVKEKLNADKKKKQVDRLKEQLKKLELQQTDRDENKTIALGTSKLNYLDPRISVAWCKKHGVPIEKIFNKTQREKFRWAIDMADENYRF